MPKKLSPWEHAARLADEYVDAWETQDGSKRALNKLVTRRNRLMVALLATSPEDSDDATAPAATVAPAP
jgi:hypothetical protein